MHCNFYAAYPGSSGCHKKRQIVHYNGLYIIPRRVAILVIIFWNFTICQNRSDSPQVKGNLISSIENLAYDLPLELPNDLRLGILGNQKILEKHQICVDTWVQRLVSPQELRLCEQQLKKIRKNRYQPFFFLPSFTGFLHPVSHTLSGIVEGGEGEISLALFRKLEKSVLILGKNALIVVFYGLNFLFKVQFLRVSRRKNCRFFPAGLFAFVLQIIFYQSPLISRKLPCHKKFLIASLVHELNFLTSMVCTLISSRNQKSQFLVLHFFFFFFCLFCSSRIQI